MNSYLLYKSLSTVLILSLVLTFIPIPSHAYTEDFTGTWIIYESLEDLQAGKKLTGRTISIEKDGSVHYDVEFQNGSSIVGKGKLVKQEWGQFFAYPDGTVEEAYFSKIRDDFSEYFNIERFCGLNYPILRRINTNKLEEVKEALNSTTLPFQQELSITREGYTIRIELLRQGGTEPYSLDRYYSSVYTIPTWATEEDLNDWEKDVGDEYLLEEYLNQSEDGNNTILYFSNSQEKSIDIIIHSVDAIGRRARTRQEYVIDTGEDFSKGDPYIELARGGSKFMTENNLQVVKDRAVNLRSERDAALELLAELSARIPNTYSINTKMLLNTGIIVQLYNLEGKIYQAEKSGEISVRNKEFGKTIYNSEYEWSPGSYKRQMASSGQSNWNPELTAWEAQSYEDSLKYSKIVEFIQSKSEKMHYDANSNTLSLTLRDKSDRAFLEFATPYLRTHIGLIFGANDFSMQPNTTLELSLNIHPDKTNFCELELRFIGYMDYKIEEDKHHEYFDFTVQSIYAGGL